MNYTQEELEQIFGSVGSNVAVHRSVAVFGGKNIHIGSNVRIDCFSLLSSGEKGITIGNYTHIGASSHLFGSGGKIQIGDFVGISSRNSLFTASDDYTEGHMANPTVADEFRSVSTGDIVLAEQVLVGCGSVILPGVSIAWGGAVGALSLVNRSIGELEIACGIPAKIMQKKRNPRLKLLTEEHRSRHGSI